MMEMLLGLNGTNQPNNQKITRFVGESLKLDCGQINSLPEATVTWSRRDRVTNVQELSLGNDVVLSVNSGTLYFRSITESHDGIYQCLVTNSLTSNSIPGSYDLTVNGELVSFSYLDI